MCGRYNIIDDQLTRTLMRELGIDLQLPTLYNIAPTEQVPVVYQQNGKRQCQSMRWWLVPSWSDGPSSQYAMFNARAESVARSPAFRGPFKRQRAILPASNFIEWQTQGDRKQPYELALADRAIAFAGLWDLWQKGSEPVYSCTIITTEAVPQFAHIHKRMPLMLNIRDCALWLDSATQEADLKTLLEPGLPSDLHATPISKAINNGRNKVPPEASGATEKIPRA